MAKGDIIAATFTVAAQNTTFQPASGIEIVLTTISNGSGDTARLTDGTNSAPILAANTMVTSAKIGIKNSIYLQINQNGAGAAYSGVQVK